MKTILLVLAILLLVLSACAVQQQASANQSVDKMDKSQAMSATKASGAATAKTGTAASATGKVTATIAKSNATKAAKAESKITVKRVANQTKPVSQPQPAPQPEPVQPQSIQQQPQKSEEPKTTTIVAILGKEGFDKTELEISSGSTVTWENNDKIDVTLTIFMEGKFYKNSELIKPGESFSIVFEEKGKFEYWAVAYGMKAGITVT
ncbi:hypothetical protein HY637_01720 [Candidatus Woesearchaeota archaeon]|nr:hypothetical protein [Candidatus Woesearchaeota archaeon]